MSAFADTSKRMKRRLLLTALAGLPIASMAQGDVPPRRVGVLSTIGDRLLVVQFVPHVGSGLDSNRQEVVRLPGSELDDAALVAVKKALSGTRLLETVFYRAPSPETFDGRLDGDIATLPPSLMAAFVEDKLTHVLLLTKRRGAARFKFSVGNGTIYEGAGSVDGVGFYLDFNMRTRTGDTNERGYGFLAPFAYFDVSLIDVASGRVLKRETVQDSRAISSAKNEEGVDPWGTLSAQQKVEILRNMIASAIARVVPPMLAG